MAGINFKSKFKMKDKFIGLVIVDSKKYHEVSTKLVKYFVKENHVAGIYVNFNKPCESLTKTLASEHVDTKNMIMIDSVTTTLNHGSKQGNCLFLGHHQNLTDISIAANEAMHAVKSEKKALIIDTLNALLIYNQPQPVIRFARFLMDKVRSLNSYGVFVIVREPSAEILIKNLTQAADTVLEI